MKKNEQAFYFYKACWSSEPFVYLCGERFLKRSQEHVTVKVYSNQKEVQLSVDGKPFGELTGEAVFVFEIDMP